MTLNYRGSKYEVNAVSPRGTHAPRKGMYRGTAVDFAEIKAKSNAGCSMTYRGSAYTTAA